MCLRVRENATRHIADCDIPVFKLLRKSGLSDMWRSPFYHGCSWCRGVKHRSTLDRPQKVGREGSKFFGVSRGLHAYINPTYIIAWDEQVFEMVVPCGAEYYISDYGSEIAATELHWRKA